MRALPVQPEPLWLTDFRQRIAVSLWFVPTIFAVASIVAADLTIWLDAQVDAPIGVRPDLVSDPSHGRHLCRRHCGRYLGVRGRGVRHHASGHPARGQPVL